MESEGFIVLDRMRCDDDRHPQWIYRHSGGKYPTRLRGQTLNCGITMIGIVWTTCGRAEFLRKIGNEINPRVELTGLGWRVAGHLRKHKSYGGTFGNFYWVPERRIG